jgi:glycogen operon protein
MNEISVFPGKPLPHGASLIKDGVNFSVFSRNAEKIWIDIFDNPNDAHPVHSFALDADQHRTGDVWHIFLKGLGAGTLYLYRVDGPFEPHNGHRFNKHNYLLDPYAKEITDCSIFKNLSPDYAPPVDSVDILLGKQFSAEFFPKCVVIDDDEFDWQGDMSLNHPLRLSVIYETHLKGLTANPNSGVSHPGTYRGMVEKIPYLKELGVTSVELLPIHEFDEYENTNINPKTGERLKNYWGYSTIAFFAPKVSYSSNRKPGETVREFKEMVREMHRNGLEVILDIVFNHTAEGNEKGVTINFRGFDNSIYYILEKDNKQYYTNYSGCGNTFNCNHPVVRTYIIDCLRYWVCEMHVDGFRFDLGSILGRDQNGLLMENPPMLERIAEDPVLRHTKIIAEAWDAGGAYQVGWFPGGRWAEWNDRFRDDIRRFWRGDDYLASAAATRVTGSSDLYFRDGRKPFHSVNFLTSHDGFTLNDLVSYNGKHNDENGEHNRDGSDHNVSFNYGFEGSTINKKIEKVRAQQLKNMLLTLLLSQGTPMLLAGDEMRRTQNGNNNAYCQDNEMTWLDWSLKNTHSELFRFVKMAIDFRLRHPAFRRPEFFAGQDHSYNNLPDIFWYDEEGKSPDWTKLNHFMAFYLDGSHAEIFTDIDDNDFYVMYNTSTKDKTVIIPQPQQKKQWYRVVDTAAAFPNDFLNPGSEEFVQPQNRYVLCARSMVVLLTK